MTGNAPGSERIVRLCGEDKGVQLMQVAQQEIVFDAATTGDKDTNSGERELFAVTGTVLCAVLAVCTEDLSAGATFTLGSSEDTDILAASPAGGSDDIDENMVWVNGDVDSEVDLASLVWILVDDVDLGYKITVADLSDGTIDFYCFWVPISDDGDVVAAGSDVAL